MTTVDAAGLPIGDGHPPRIMGVLNVSAESPYDPSVFDDPEAAATYVDEELIEEGADIVDIGLESANKRFEVLSAEEERARLDVALETIDRVDRDAIFSIETRYASVADAALSRGFDMVNDICGFADPGMPEVCASHDAAVVAMAGPPDLERPGAIDDVDWAERRSPEWAAESDYVDRLLATIEDLPATEKTIVDPAFGGWSDRKTLADDRETLRRLAAFREFDAPVLVSINRKNFLGDLVDRRTSDRLPASLAGTALAVERGADVIRTHDVAATRDAALVGDAFGSVRS
ncbi:dihydropteroate synthase [Halovivax limisalsi]|uniref:dihydropteroate synthase n=1 Tax=Halovivax limisalsi TaxID=1453760 RepID=UPI001FFD1E41|nr:dihydropteroate synthase [Halovivax limisalsi]